MFEVLSFLKGFSSVISVISDSASGIDHGLHSIAENLDSIKTEIHALSKSVEQLSSSISEIPDTMREIAVFGRELEGLGHVISASKSLESGVIEDARIELNRAKDLAPSCWYLWVGYVWLHTLEISAQRINSEAIQDCGVEQQEKIMSLEKAIRYVGNDKQLHEIYKLNLLFTLLGIAQYYSVDDLRSMAISHIFEILETTEPRDFKTLRTLLLPIKPQIKNLKDTSWSKSFQNIIDNAYEDLVEKDWAKINKPNVDSLEYGYGKIDNLISIGTGIVSDRMIIKTESLKSELFEITTNNIASKIRGYKDNEIPPKDIKYIAGKIDLISKNILDSNLKKLLLGKAEDLKNMLYEQVTDFYKSQLCSKENWSPRHLDVLKQKLMSLCQDAEEGFSPEIKEKFKKLKQNIETVEEKFMGNLVEVRGKMSDILGETIKKRTGIEGFIEFLSDVSSLLWGLVSVLLGIIIFFIISVIVEGNIILSIISLFLALIAGYYSNIGLNKVSELIFAFVSDVNTKVFSFIDRKKIEELMKYWEKLDEEREEIEREITRFLRSNGK